MLRLWSQELLLPKHDSSIAECEDAIGRDDAKRRYAVADGATEAFDARGWAARLVRGWTESQQLPQTPAEFTDWATQLGTLWEEDWRERRLPWFAQEKRQAGSFAALIGLAFWEEVSAWRWRAVAVGDACLVRVRGGEVRGAMPINDYREFNTTPRLVPSADAYGLMREADVHVEEGNIESGDVFWLLSDAAAAWFLRAHAERRPHVAEFEQLLVRSEHDALVRFVDAQRNFGELRDDDIAVVRIEAIGS